MNNLSWSYVAGFFDGEGSISPRITRTVGYNISIAQSGRRGQILLEEIREFLLSEGLNTLHVVVCKVNFPRLGKKEMYQLRIRNIPDCTKFLTCTLPYLRIKRTEAQDVLRARKLWPPLSGQLRAMIVNECRYKHYHKFS